MHGVDVPARVAGVHVERHHGRGEGVLGRRAVAAVLVGGGVAGAHEHQAQTLVGRDHVPHVGRAARPQLACGQRGLRIVGTLGVPGPAQRAGNGVVGAHHAARRVAALVVADLLAHDDQPTHHRRPRGVGREADHLVAHALGQVHGAAVAEAGTHLPAGRVQRDQPAVGGGQQDAARAQLASGRLRLLVVADGAAGGAEQRLHRGRRHLGVEVPLLAAGGRVEREHLAAGRAHVQAVADLQRRVLEGVVHALVGRPVVGVERPGLLELPNVARRDLRRLGKALAQVGAAEGQPLVGTALQGGAAQRIGRGGLRRRLRLRRPQARGQRRQGQRAQHRHRGHRCPGR